MVALMIEPDGEKRKMEDRSAVVAALDASAAAWSKGDLGSFMQLYHDDSEVIYVSENTFLRGFDAIREMYESRFGVSAPRMGHLSLSVLAYQPLGADYALVTGRYGLERSIDSGGNSDGFFTMVLRRTDRGWKIIFDHAS